MDALCACPARAVSPSLLMHTPPQSPCRKEWPKAAPRPETDIERMRVGSIGSQKQCLARAGVLGQRMPCR